MVLFLFLTSFLEVNIYIETPPNTRARDFSIKIKTNNLTVGLKNSDDHFLDEKTFSKVNTSESSWYLSDSGELHIVLIKQHRGEAWEGALVGRKVDGKNDGVVDPMTKEAMKQHLMRERYQEECPGFDFRNAEFNGDAPDPRKFMGGIGRGR